MYLKIIIRGHLQAVVTVFATRASGVRYALAAWLATSLRPGVQVAVPSHLDLLLLAVSSSAGFRSDAFLLFARCCCCTAGPLPWQV